MSSQLQHCAEKKLVQDIEEMEIIEPIHNCCKYEAIDPYFGQP
jgi:hypothetical protein